jgi:lipoyl(octanoyl) transferase
MTEQRTAAARTLEVRELGVLPYGDALGIQRALADDRIAGRIPDTLLLLEHPPVVTLGRGTRPGSLPIDPETLRRRGIEVFEIERGGDVTYHGPGQLVGYPILDLQQHKPDLHWYLRQLETSLIAALDTLGIDAEQRPGLTGVWTAGRKIASIGIHVRQWVTWHGFALNVTTDLSPFSLIVPCGIPDVVMTSVAKETNAPSGKQRDGELHAAVRRAVVQAFRTTFGFETAGQGDWER